MPSFAPLATPRLTPEVVLSRLIKMTAKTSGLSSIFMLAQYSSPLVVGLLLALARLRARYTAGGGASLRNMAKGWTSVSTGAAEARIVMRTAGLLPIIQWLLALHPNPIAAVRSLLKVRSVSALSSSAKLVPTIQALSLAVYYPAEHVWYLASKGFLGLSPAATNKAATILIQGWAMYVVVEVFKIAHGFKALQKRTLKLQHSKPKVDVEAAEGYELQDEKTYADAAKSDSEVKAKEDVGTEAVNALKNDWEDWALNAALYAGYAPLTAHWATPGGLGPMKNQWVYAGLGTLTGVASVLMQWKAAAV